MTDGDIVYTEEVASLQEMVGELAVLRKLVFERRTQDVAGNAVAAIECIQGVGSSHIVIDIETEATVSVDAQIPILVGQTGGQTAIVRGLGTLTSDVLVRVFFARSDGAVFGKRRNRDPLPVPTAGIFLRRSGLASGSDCVQPDCVPA